MTAAVKPPSRWLLLLEAAAPLEYAAGVASAPWLLGAPRGDGHAVIVYPGFLASDLSTRPMRRLLRVLGHDARGWDQGRNLGARAEAFDRALARVQAVHAETGRRVSLVGWSLGGVMARQLSRRRPDAVRQVISLGSPFAGTPKATNVWRTYQALTGQKIDDHDVRAQLRESELPPPVPSTAIYTREDGVVAWQNCREPEAPHTDNIEVHGSHCGLGVNPAVLYAIADRLAQKDGAWKPFDRTGLRALVYPEAARD
jgi:pimeloyl-ACP methyl ester carboxylesterase